MTTIAAVVGGCIVVFGLAVAFVARRKMIAQGGGRQNDPGEAHQNDQSRQNDQAEVSLNDQGEAHQNDALSAKPQGVSVEFLVLEFDEALQKEFGDQYTESTTFVELGEMLWGPEGERFEKTRDLFGHVSMPNEKRGGKRGVSLCTAIAKKSARDVSDATLFISWTWRYSVKQFIRTLHQYCHRHRLPTRTTYVWVCFLCNDQFDWLAGGKKDGVEEFGKVVAQIGKVVCVVDHYLAAQALYFGRVWTVYEVHFASRHNIRIDIALMANAKIELDKANFGSVREGMVVDVMEAKASNQEDEDRIKEIVRQQGGGPAMNETVAELFVKMISGMLRTG